MNEIDYYNMAESLEDEVLMNVEIDVELME
jgi:hypothetical protein